MNASQMRTRRGEPNADVFALKLTKWKNPTPNPQRVTLYEADNTPIVVEWAPAGHDGDTRDVPSRFDSAIQRIDCHMDGCHKGAGRRGGGWYCTKGHNGTIVGGAAPLLKRIDPDGEVVPNKLADGLDPNVAELKQAEADRAAAAIATDAAQQALVTAEHRARKVSKEIESVEAAAAATSTPAAATAATSPRNKRE